MASIYFGGSRSLAPSSSLLRAVVGAVVASGQSVHVGCQRGADSQVIAWALHLGAHSSLVVFAVAAAWQACPRQVQLAQFSEARVVLGAGGQSAPMPARYLLRSIAAFQGCSAAVFFSPGPGSLAVAREAINAGISVFAFGTPHSGSPAPVPSSIGFWVESSFQGSPCWQWQPTVTQPSLF